MPQTPHIRILMCTFNGAAHLHEQLDSFLQQSHDNWSLWASDDGSVDATKDILETFRAENPNRDIRILDGPGQGAAANFLSLMQRCAPEPGMMVALSDQDDVWLPAKLARAAEAIAAAPGIGENAGPNGRPVAYGAAQVIASADLSRQRPSRPMRAGPSFGNALVQNILSGNSLVLNPAMLALIRRTLPAGPVPGHDWWVYQLVTGAGGHVIYDTEPALIYRQHGSNTLGSNRGLRAMRLRVGVVWSGEYLDWIRANAAALQAARAELTAENRALLDRFAKEIGQRGLRRARSLKALGIRRQSKAGHYTTLLLGALGRV